MATILERKWKGGTTHQVKVRKMGRKASETFDRKSDAMRWAEDREEEIKNKLPFPWEKGEFKGGVFEKDDTLVKAIGKFIHETTGSVSSGQTDNYLTYQNQLIRYFGSDKMMSDIAHADMAAYILKRTSEDGGGQ